MRKSLLASILVVTAASGALAMGGGGGGYGGGGSFGGGHATLDDYAQALRLIHHEKYAEAIPHLDLALAKRPGSADILNYEGYAHRMIGDYSASLDYYNRALAIEPDHKGVHEYLGELYLQEHDLEKAQTELAKLASLCPSGCEEKDTLTASIAKYQTANAAAPAATASPASANAPAAPSAPATPAAPASGG